MPKLALWHGVNARHGKNYNFMDKNISRFMYVSGTAVYVHLYAGVYDQAAANGAIMAGGISSIQDTLFLENRDRKYDPCIRELRGTYNVQDISFDMKQFGIFLTDDTLFLEIHLNDMVAACGRRIIAGDVIELPHRRDDQIPGDAPAINAFFVVDEGSWATDGYSSTWFQHIWRIKCSPMTASQEFADILNQQATDPFGLNDVGTLGSLMSTLATEQGINNSVVDAAVANFKYRYFETQQFWIMPGTELGSEYPWVFASDGIPPNGQLLSQGTSFPGSPTVGDYFLRTDYSPATLFKRVINGWQIQEFDRRQQEWSVANRLLHDFINNDNNTEFSDGTVIPQKQGLSNAVAINKNYGGITLTQPAMADIIPAIGDIEDDGEAESAGLVLFSGVGSITDISNVSAGGMSFANSYGTIEAVGNAVAFD
jgi:hypothetical protein